MIGYGVMYERIHNPEPVPYGLHKHRRTGRKSSANSANASSSFTSRYASHADDERTPATDDDGQHATTTDDATTDVQPTDDGAGSTEAGNRFCSRRIRLQPN